MADDARDGAKQLRTDGAPGRMGGGPGHEGGGGGAGDAWSSRRVSGQPGADGMDGMNGPARPRLPPGMCRDFHIRGFCARGDSCKYTHLPPAMPMPPGPPGGAPGHGPRRGLPGSNGGPQGPPRAGDVEMGNGPEMGPGGPGGGGMPGMPPGSMPPQMSMEQMQQMAAQFGFPGMPGMPMMPAFGPGGPGGPGGGDRGRRPPRGQQGYFPNRPAKSATTLVIENLPAENLDLIQINDRFKRFGTITNIQIDKAGRKALVSYSEPDEAKAAHSDPDAVFGSRFVKVYFQRLEEQPQQQQGGPGGPQQQQQQQQQSHQRGPPSWNAPSASAPSYSRPAIVTEADVRMMQTDAKAKQSSLDALLEEQKTLMGGISTMDADAKKTAMTRLRELSTAIPAATQQARQAAEKVQNVGPITPIPEASKALLVAKAKKQQLDRELDAISKGGGMQVDGDGEGAEGQTTEELKAKLESLKAEAASLGLDASGAPIRGAGRGRGRFTTRGGYAPRGRGGFQRGFASLDNRTKELRIDATTESGEAIQGDKRKNVETWLKTFGEIESLADGQDGKLVVVWKNRHEGDKVSTDKVSSLPCHGPS